MSDARNKKRRASGHHENEPEKKKGRPSRADLDSHAHHDAMNRVQARRMLRRYPAVRSTGDDDGFDYDNLVSWRVVERWDEEDDAAVDEQWNQSELKESTKDLNTPQYASLFKLFRISLRLFKTTPNTIVSPLFCLRYQPVSKNSLCNDWIMSKTFCDHLMSLMVHPCFEQDRELLTLALQWTVICRLDSRRRWLRDGFPKSCPVLEPLFEEIESYRAKRLSISYHEMHERARGRAVRQGESPSEFSDLLYQVGEAVHEDKRLKPKVDPEFEAVWGLRVLPLTIWDLRVLSNAVNSTNFSPEWNFSVEDAMKGWKAETSGHELPTQDKLSLVYECSQKNVFRQIRLMLRKPLTDADDDEDEPIDSSLSSDDNESGQDTPPPPRKSRRRTPVDVSSDEEGEPVSETTRSLPKVRRRRVDDAEIEASEPVRPSNYDRPSAPQPDLGDEEEDDDMGDIYDASAGLDSGEFFPQDTHESVEFRPHGPTLSERQPLQPPASPIYASLREKQMLSELSELRKENRKLRDGQQRLLDLFAQGVNRQNEVISQGLKQQKDLMLQGQREQNKLMLSMQDQLKSMQSELGELRQAKRASNQGDDVQNHPERPSLPEATVTALDSALKSPELGTNSLAPQQDVTSLEEVTGLEPMDEDIPPEQEVPKQKTPEPETSEQPVTAAPETLQSAPEQDTRKQKTPQTSAQRKPVREQHHEPVSINPKSSKEAEVRTQVVSQLPPSIGETSNPRTRVTVSSRSLTKDSLRGLAKRPARSERRIGSMRGLASALSSNSSVQRDIFVTPRSELLKVWKKTG